MENLYTLIITEEMANQRLDKFVQKTVKGIPTSLLYKSIRLKKIHPNSKVIAIDAGIGQSDDVGLIKILNHGLKPGLGVDKNLSTIGDISVVGIVASRSVGSVNLFNYTRLNLVYKMARIISDGLLDYLQTFSHYNSNINAV